MKTAAKTSIPQRRRWLVYLFVGAIGASSAWVLVEHALAKNRLIELGRQQREAEFESSELDRDIRRLTLSIGEECSRKNLQDRLAMNRTRLRPISSGAPILVKLDKEPTP